MADDAKQQDTSQIEADFLKNNPKFTTLAATMKKENKRHPLYDLTSSKQEAQIRELSELALLSDLVDTSSEQSFVTSIQALHDLQFGIFANHREDNEFSLMLYLALSNARSKLSMQLMAMRKAEFNVTIIVPLWGEHHRMQSKSVHQNGEDFVRRKVKQLEWLFDRVPEGAMDWNLMFVDDGCPNGSGKELIKLMDADKEFFTENLRKKITVEFLAEALETIDKFKNDDTLKTVNDSRKGGAVQYGFFKALDQPHSAKNPTSRLIMYTDADLSADLSQIGLLLRDITIENPKGTQRKAVIADRYAKGIFSDGDIIGTFKTNAVAMRLRGFFRGKLLPPFRQIDDSQCGLKVFSRHCIEKVLLHLESYQGMFDMELLMKIHDLFSVDKVKEQIKDMELEADAAADHDEKGDENEVANQHQPIWPTGIVWLHSAEESNFSTAQFTSEQFTNGYGWKHFNQIQEIIAIHNRNYKESALCEKEWVNFIAALNWKQYFQICQILFLRGVEMRTFCPEIKDLEALIKEEYPEDAPKWIEDPSKV
jgi:hypothetical protein